MNMKSPSLYIIAGCNGAGKTTASFTILPDVLDCQQFVNADEIAQGPFSFSSGECLDGGRTNYAPPHRGTSPKGITFAIETTLATRSYHSLIDRAHKLGYLVHLLYIGFRRRSSQSNEWHSESARVATTSHKTLLSVDIIMESVTFSTFSCLLSIHGLLSTTPVVARKSWRMTL